MECGKIDSNRFAGPNRFEFKVTKDNWFWYQSKARMRLGISE